MRFARPMLLGLVFLGMITGFPAVGQPTEPSTVPADHASAPAQPIVEAQNPSSAVAAYARASAAAPDDLRVLNAYVQRMTDFGLPALAEVQANELNRRDPQNGLAWAVTAYVNAKKGEPELAIAQIQIAAARAADDPFVQRTAGQLLAWYDSCEPPPRLPDVVRGDIAKLRQKLAQSEAFADAYRLASAEYHRDGQADEIAQSPPQTTPATEPYEVRVIRPSDPGPPSDYITHYDQGNAYTAPYRTSPAPGYSRVSYPCYDWCDRYRPAGWWWFGSKVIVVKDCGRHAGKFDCFDKSKECGDDFAPRRKSSCGKARVVGTNGVKARPGDRAVRVRSSASNAFVGPVQRNSTFVGPLQQISDSPPRAREPSGIVGAARRNSPPPPGSFVGPLPQQDRFVGPQPQARANTKSRSVKSPDPRPPKTFVGPVQNPPRRSNVAKRDSDRSAPAKVSPGRAEISGHGSTSRGSGGNGKGSPDRSGRSPSTTSRGASAGKSTRS